MMVYKDIEANLELCCCQCTLTHSDQYAKLGKCRGLQVEKRFVVLGFRV